MTTTEAVDQILYSIVRADPYDSKKEWKRLNTFASIYGKSEWQSSSFEKSELDVNNKRYFTRGDGNNRKSGYFTVEHTSCKSLHDIICGTWCDEFWLTVAYDPQCEPCKGLIDKRSLFICAKEKLVSTIMELSCWCKYDFTKGEETGQMWVSPEIKVKMESEGYVFGGCCGKMKNLIQKVNGSEIYKNWNLSAEGLVGASVKITICNCEKIDKPTLDYNYKDCEDHGSVICPCLSI